MNETNVQIYYGSKDYRNNSIFKCLIGDYFLVYSWVIPFFILYFIPWEDLYSQPLYSRYIEIVTVFLPVLDNIKESNIAFKEYAISYLAFVDVLGSIGVFYIFVYAFLTLKISDSHNVLEKSLRQVSGSLVMIMLFAFFFFPYSIYFWDGTIPMKSTQLPIMRKDAFIVASLTMWWGFNFSILCIPISIKLLIRKIANTKGI